MAHQAHNLPWQTLASNLKFVHDNNSYEGRTNLYPKFKPEQGKQLTYFAKAFAKTVKGFSRTERDKYPKEYNLLEPENIIISPAMRK
jgi:hypothetical protein